MTQQSKSLDIQLDITEGDRLTVFVTDEDTGVDVLVAPLQELVAINYHSIAEVDVRADLRATAVALRALASNIEQRCRDAENPPEENYMLEFRSAGTDTWHASPHPARPRSQAETYAKEANARDRSVVYRAVPWDGV